MIQLVNALPDYMELCVIIPDRYKFYSRALKNNVKVITYNWHPRHLHPENLITTLGLIRKIIRFNPEIIHTQSGGNIWFFLGYPFLKKFPIVTTIHDPVFHFGEKKKWVDLSTRLRYLKKYNRFYFVNGENLREKLAWNYNIPMEKIISVRRGDYSIYLTWDKPDVEEERNTILFFGRIWKYKGLEYLIKAEPLVSREIPNVKIIIAGRGENFSEYRSMIQDPDRFEIHNYWIPVERMVEFYRRSVVVVLPYVDASQSGVVPLAFNCNKPVIVTSVGALPEMVDDGRTGIIVPPGDEKRLALAIIRLLKDNNLLKSMKRNIIEKMKSDDMTWKTASRQTLKVYEKVLYKE
jgi:glycosyltransferase involved in cell wall biosynthesis